MEIKLLSIPYSLAIESMIALPYSSTNEANPYSHIRSTIEAVVSQIGKDTNEHFTRINENSFQQLNSGSLIRNLQVSNGYLTIKRMKDGTEDLALLRVSRNCKSWNSFPSLLS